MKKKTRILFVCLGNICRSPSAEAVMQSLVDEAGLTDSFEIDSAGTSAYHAGEPADARMQRHARRRGYTLTSISRRFDAQRDFARFDLVIGMDDENMNALRRLDHSGRYHEKIKRMSDFGRSTKLRNIPDPYFGGDAGFEEALDLLEDCCAGLLEQLQHNA